jgi:transcriptional regulator with XRE-family HTH domain
MHYPNLKLLRLRNDFKQEYVADFLKISQSEYSRLEGGQRKLDAETIRQLCKLYNIGSEILLHHRVQPLELEMALPQAGAGDASFRDLLEKLLNNYNTLLANYVHQQQILEKMVDRLPASGD